MIYKTLNSYCSLAILAILLLQTSKGQDFDDEDQVPSPIHEKLVSEEEMRIESKPQAPYWLKPKTMEQNLLIKVLNMPVRLRCQAGGQPEPTIHWLKDGMPIKEAWRPDHLKPYMEKPEKFQLTIPGMDLNDEGNYTCIVQNQFGILNFTFAVEALKFLKHVPVLMGRSENQTVMEGMTARFFCKFDSDLGLITHWARPSRKALEIYGDDFPRNLSENFESVLNRKTGEAILGEKFVLENTTLADSGLYFCIGQTNSAMEMEVLHLKVLKKSEAVLEKPENVSVTFGEDAIFSCKTHKALREHTSWVRLGQDIIELANGTEVLRIQNVTEDDLGFYACVVGTDVAHIHHYAYLEATEPTKILTMPDSKWNLKVIAISVVPTVLLTVFLVFIWRKLQRERIKKQQAIDNALAVTQWTKKVIIERQNVGPESPIVAPVIRIEKQNSVVNSANRSRLGSENTTLTTISEYELPLDPDWEWPRGDIKLGVVLGEGAFGKVMKAEVSSILYTGTNGQTVAVKMLKEGHTDNEMIDLVSEMDMMKMIGKHINIINLLGVCTQDGPLFVIVEFAEHGNLRQFLRGYNSHNDGYEKPNSHRQMISERQLLSFARQVCKGMEYLHSMKCIHRDLAARNVLVSKDYIIKIADFGLARDVHKNDYYKKVGDGWLPIRWMAPEAIFHRKYTTRSDVWSFGILLWEIMTLGASPYPSVASVEKLFELLKQGYRMDRPSNCSLDVYMIMRACWSGNSVERPTFTRLVEEVDRLLTNAKEGDYLEMGMTSNSNDNTSETMLCAGNGGYYDNSGQTVMCGLSNTSSLWNRTSSPLSDSVNLYSQSVLIPPPTIMAPLPPDQLLPHPPGLDYGANSHANLTYNNILADDVTYTPMMSTYWNNNYPHQTSTFRPQPPPRTTPTRHPYVNQAHQQIYCDHTLSTPSVSSEDEVTLPMNDIRQGDYQEQYASHLQSSSL